MTESHLSPSTNYDELKQWVYPMFFSTRSGGCQIRIIKSTSNESKKIGEISDETHMNYYRANYNVKLLVRDGFLIKDDDKYVISPKFRENYDVLTEITNKKFNLNEKKS